MKIEVIMSFRAMVFLLISLLHGGRSYDVTNNDDLEQWKQSPYYDVTHGKTINNPRIKEFIFINLYCKRKETKNEE